MGGLLKTDRTSHEGKVKDVTSPCFPAEMMSYYGLPLQTAGGQLTFSPLLVIHFMTLHSANEVVRPRNR